MGGLTGGRYIGPRGTTGDLTGGGGRSVMPNRDLINNVIARRQRILGARERMFEADRAAKLAAGTAGEYYPIQVPPGGGYSGGVIPRFQGGSKIRGQGAAARARGRGRAPARRQQPWTWVPEEGLWGLPNTGDPGYFYTLKQPGQGGAPAYTPGGGGGGYSGGVIPRFQQGRALTPRAVKKAWGFSRPGNPAGMKTRMPLADRQRSFARMQAGEIPHFGTSSGGSWGPPPPGGWQAGGGVIPRFQSGRTVNPRAGGESAMQRQRRMQWNNRTTPIPAGWGAYGAPFGQGARFPSPPGGWQEGGQFPEATFPVESELADESPWYPDEEVGFEAAAPMQGGFDIFGRSGG